MDSEETRAPRSRRRYNSWRYARHVLRWWNEASDVEKAEGLTWYARAHAECVLLAERHAVTVPCAVGVVAALSPQTRWERNIRCAEQAFRGQTVTGAYGLNVAKAQRIIAGASPEDVLSGPKVTAFYALILSAGTSSELCVDSIAILAATGVDPNPLVSNGDAAPVFNRPRQLEAIREAYKRVAETHSVQPSAVQATVWLAWRNERDAQ